MNKWLAAKKQIHDTWPDPPGRLSDQGRNDIRIVAGFLNAYHGVFQRYLDEELKIDPAEAEVIIGNLNSLADLDD